MRSYLPSGIFFTVLVSLTLSCGSKDEEDGDVSATSGTEFNEDGFLDSGVGVLRIGVSAASGETATSGLRVAEPTDPNEKYYFGKRSLGGGADELTIYITKMVLKDSSASEEVPIFVNPDGKPLRIVGNRVDMSNFFTEIGCYSEAGDVLPDPCPCGVDVDGNIIEQVDALNDDGSVATDPETGEVLKACPLTETSDTGEPPVVEKNPIAFINVSQVGSFDTLKVSYRNDALASGCVQGYVQRADVPDSDENAHNVVEWERYCTKSAQGSDKTEAGESFARSTFADATGTAEGELQTIYLTAQYTGENPTANADYEITGGITITEDDSNSPQITMLIDVGSLLRFHIDDNIEGRKHNEFETWNGAFFYVRLFSAQNFVFVGEAGSIRGYTLELNLKEQNEDLLNTPSGTAANPSAYDECVLTNNDCSFVGKGRISLIYDKDGSPLLFNLTTIVGNSWDFATQSREGAEAGQAISADESLAGTYKLEYENTDGQGDVSDTKIYQLGLDVDVGSSFTSYGYRFIQTSAGETRMYNWGKLVGTREY